MTVKELRDEMAMTQVEFAWHIGHSPSAVINWEKSDDGRPPCEFKWTAIVMFCRSPKEYRRLRKAVM